MNISDIQINSILISSKTNDPFSGIKVIDKFTDEKGNEKIKVERVNYNYIDKPESWIMGNYHLENSHWIPLKGQLILL